MSNHNSLMLHTYKNPHTQYPTIHQVAAKVEQIAINIVMAVKDTIRKIIKDGARDIKLEELLGVLETIEERLAEKNIDIAQTLLIITDIIKETIENHREMQVARLPELLKIQLKAACLAAIAGVIAKNTSKSHGTIRHKLWPKQSLNL